MNLNALEIYLLARELDGALRGKRIREVREKGHTLWFRMEDPPHLLVSLHPSHLGAALTGEVAGEPVEAFTQPLRGRRVVKIRARAGDRLWIVHAGDRALVVELTGKHRNVFVLDEETRVMVARFSSRLRPGEPYTFPPKPSPDFRTLLAEQPSRLVPLAPYLARVPDPVAYICQALKKPQPVLIETPEGPVLAPYPIPVRPGEREQPLATLSEGFLMLLEGSESESPPSAEDPCVRLRRRLEEELGRLAHFEAYRRLGERILQEFPSPPEERRVIREGEVEVEIHPGEDPVGVAQKLFARYKKMKRGYETLRKRLAELRCGPSSPPLPREPEAPPVPRRPYRVFRGPRGSRILVGRSAQDNHRLTFHISPPHAWWFHVRDLPGAHVVISDPDPPEEDREEAARLAVWFSDARSGKSGEVWVTRRQHLRSVRGSPGKVRILRGETRFVRLPEGWEPVPWAD